MRSAPDLGPIVRPHFVVKRGHRGRHRFVMIAGGERISGEVWIDAETSSPEVAHALALAKVARLAETLLAAVEARAASTRGPSVDVSPARFQTFGEGEHHGQV